MIWIPYMNWNQTIIGIDEYEIIDDLSDLMKGKDQDWENIFLNEVIQVINSLIYIPKRLNF